MEVGSSIAVEENTDILTFFRVSHRRLELFSVSHETEFFSRVVARVSLFEAFASFINSHISITLIEGSLCLVHETLSFVVVDTLLSYAEDSLHLVFRDSASIECRSWSLPIPYYNTFVVTTRVQATKFPTVFSCTTEAFTSPKVGRIESKEACLVAVCHDVIRS